MFALAFETTLFTLTADKPAWDPLFALQPRITSRKPEQRRAGKTTFEAKVDKIPKT
jgi:hypothetical protein